ncbi:MAG TPA: SIR2 family protein [Blastocatellia bacterium]|nr:SIR2 family protein [Blastocatellia bacterium]
MLNTIEQANPNTGNVNNPDKMQGCKPQPLDAKRWASLLRAISEQRCTPFLGAEACFGAVPTASEIAREWANEYGYPLEDSHDLARVAQFVATEYRDPLFPKSLIKQRFQEIDPPNFGDPDEPHGALADLPLPVYITTNYYDFMVQALKSSPRYKDPRREWCRWNEPKGSEPSIFASGFKPTPANPVVYHLHGHITAPESLVLTEDDYLDFLVNTSKEPDLVPARIQTAFTRASLLFLGYRFTDLAFRVLLRSLVSHLQINPTKAHVSVQLVAMDRTDDVALIERAQAYLGRYCEGLDIGVYWGTCRQFVNDLRQNWEEFKRPK